MQEFVSLPPAIGYYSNGLPYRSLTGNSKALKVQMIWAHLMTTRLTLSLFYLVALVLLIPNIRVSYSASELGEQHRVDGRG